MKLDASVDFNLAYLSSTAARRGWALLEAEKSHFRIEYALRRTSRSQVSRDLPIQSFKAILAEKWHVVFKRPASSEAIVCSCSEADGGSKSDVSAASSCDETPFEYPKLPSDSDADPLPAAPLVVALKSTPAASLTIPPFVAGAIALSSGVVPDSVRHASELKVLRRVLKHPAGPGLKKRPASVEKPTAAVDMGCIEVEVIKRARTTEYKTAGISCKVVDKLEKGKQFWHVFKKAGDSKDESIVLCSSAQFGSKERALEAALTFKDMILNGISKEAILAARREFLTMDADAHV